MRQALRDRLALSEALEVVGQMIRGYANSGQAGKGYIGAIAEVLMQFPRSIALRSADLTRGVPRETKFIPTPADVIAWCERETEAMRKPVDVEDRDRMFAEQRRRMAEEAQKWEEKRKARPDYDDLRAKYGPTWGIAQAADDPATKSASETQLAEANERALLGEYERAGIEPCRMRDGTLISLSLRRAIEAQDAHRKAIPETEDD